MTTTRTGANAQTGSASLVGSLVRFACEPCLLLPSSHVSADRWPTTVSAVQVAVDMGSGHVTSSHIAGKPIHGPTKAYWKCHQVSCASPDLPALQIYDRSAFRHAFSGCPYPCSTPVRKHGSSYDECRPRAFINDEQRRGPRVCGNPIIDQHLAK